MAIICKEDMLFFKVEEIFIDHRSSGRGGDLSVKTSTVVYHRRIGGILGSSKPHRFSLDLEFLT